jgi:phage replication-related protein YjqB (UPF0714/DUF867 family)
MPTEYSAQILKLRPEQDDLKNESELCSADPVTLKSIGRSLRQQVRVSRDNTNFVALFTVKQANPAADLSDPELANVVRMGQTGRERLGDAGEMTGIVHAKVVDDGPQPGDVSFFELAEDDGKQGYFIAIAPHGGEIEPFTDDQAKEVFTELKTRCFPASFWLCKGDGDSNQGAFKRFHITADDLQPACFPLLEPLASRTFCYGVAFHGFDQKEDEADVYIGGAGSQRLKRAIEKALNDLNLSMEVKISTCSDPAKFQGFSPENIINRLATGGIQLEQSRDAREKFGQQIAGAVAKVFASRRRLLFCIFVQNLQARRAEAETELVRALSKDLAAGPLNVERAIAKHRAFRAKDDALAAKIRAAEELETFIEEHVEEVKPVPPKPGVPTESSRSRPRGSARKKRARR